MRLARPRVLVANMPRQLSTAHTRRWLPGRWTTLRAALEGLTIGTRAIPSMFRDNFWLSLVLTIPVVLPSHDTRTRAR